MIKKTNFLIKLSCIFLFSLLTGCEFMYVSALSISCAARSELSVTHETWPIAIVGQEYSATLNVENSETPVFDVSVQHGQLPPGLKLSHIKGESNFTITGISTERGEHVFTLSMASHGTQCAGQTGLQEIKIISLVAPK